MKHNKRKTKEIFHKFCFVLIGLFLISIGIVALLIGKLHYSNWWGGLVFAPVAIFIGLMVIYIALFRF